MVLVDVLYRKIALNQFPCCYMTVHNKYVEMVVLGHDSNMLFIALETNYKEVNWNKKFPKLLKKLQSEGEIDNFQMDRRYSFECNEEARLERTVRKFVTNIELVEENRSFLSYQWGEIGERRRLC